MSLRQTAQSAGQHRTQVQCLRDAVRAAAQVGVEHPLQHLSAASVLRQSVAFLVPVMGETGRLT